VSLSVASDGKVLYRYAIFSGGQFSRWEWEGDIWRTVRLLDDFQVSRP
jgi:hypothetical protein